ncbi:segregation/condensation protein A [Candidatus Woesearchaeota archaeon]|nr:segregation/condensation protein A [Candidatus Woesearchaeota archaeon]
MQSQLLEILMQKDEITWQTLIYDLVKSGEMDPWDVDISILAKKYLETVKKLQEANLSLSGKVLLAAAILLNIKSQKLLSEGFSALDNLLFPQSELESLDAFESGSKRIILDENPRLTIKTPQARKRKVSVDDLIDALEKAFEVNERRLLRLAERERLPEMHIPVKQYDITELIQKVYGKIQHFFVKKQTLTFTELAGSQAREDKILTFIPLLHLSNQSRIELEQTEHFGEIHIKLLSSEVST